MLSSLLSLVLSIPLTCPLGIPGPAHFTLHWPGYVCSAVPVADGTAVTAKHCIGPEPRTLRTDHGVTYAVDKMYVHPTEDIAVVTYVGHAPLADADFDYVPRSGDAVLITGRGCEGVWQLRTGVVAGVDAGGLIIYGCACFGDSGGGVYHDGRLVAIVSAVSLTAPLVRAVPLSVLKQSSPSPASP